jgi:hypothetical protein
MTDDGVGWQLPADLQGLMEVFEASSFVLIHRTRLGLATGRGSRLSSVVGLWRRTQPSNSANVIIFDRRTGHKALCVPKMITFARWEPLFPRWTERGSVLG